MITPTRTPVGVSMARYRRASATSVTIPATTALPNCRIRPCGIRAYSMPTSRAVSIATGANGYADWAAGPSIAIPAGRSDKACSRMPLAR